TGLVSAILGDKPHTAFALDASAGKRNGQTDLARCLGRLATLGHKLQLELWDGDFQPEAEQAAKKPVFSVAINGANYMKPRPVRPPSPPRQLASHNGNQSQNQNNLQTGAKNMQQTDTNINAASQATLTESLRVTREGMAVLQKMQEETARLHQRFLEGQETATRTIQSLLMQQPLMQGSTVESVTVPQHITPPVYTPPQQTTAAKAEPAANQPVATVSMPVPAAAPATEDSSKITATLLAVVAEKTGYPVEMLELDMGMDSDLGIDSIKRVEILSALQEKLPQAPVIGPEQLGTLRTLGDIANYLQQGDTLPAGTVQTCCINQPAPTTLDQSLVTETLLAVVAEKTGYPVEMLELEMGMDSDLGIDSIKRVEILSALQEKLPQAPVIGPEQLGTLRTLGDIANYLQQGEVIANSAAQPVCCAPQAGTASLELAQVIDTLLIVVAEKTGYPVEMLELEMGMDSDLGIDSIKRVEILSALQEKLPQAPVIGPEQLGTLRTLGDIANYLCQQEDNGKEPAPDKEKPQPATITDDGEKIEKPLIRSTIKPIALPYSGETISIFNDGEIWVANDASPFAEKLCGLLRADGHHVRLVDLAETEVDASRSDISGLVLIAPITGSDDQFLENSFLMLKNCAPALRRAAASGGALFATVSRLDGCFGCNEQSKLLDPLSGGLAGLVKTASREWSDVNCKAIDIAGFKDNKDAALAVKEELFRNDSLEVGLTPDQRTRLELTELPQPLADSTTLPLQKGDVVVVTGGGRGVTTAAVVALADAFKPTLLLLGRSSEQLDEADWLHDLHEESDIKKAILVHAKGKLHPRDIEEQYRTIMAGRELRDTLARVEAVGGQAIYRSVDIRDNEAVAALLENVRTEFGPIRGIVHGAGVLADRLIMDKTKEQFNLVYGTKVNGLRTLLAATTSDKLRFIALFGSTTGRFGRKGQVDYAVANEVLNKLAQAEARQRPDCRVVSFNWGPWDGGMVTPALKKVFADEGIGLISLQTGGEFLTREISIAAGPVELVALAADGNSQQIITCKQSAKPLSPAFNINLAPDSYPFLASHVIDGKAVLPMAMVMEWFAQGALHSNPGLYYHGINDLRICKGVTLGAEESLNLQIMAGRAEKQDSLYHVPLELISTNSENGRAILHAKGEVVLARQLPEGIRSLPDPPLAPYAPLNNNIYDPKRLFHGTDLQGINQITSCSPKGIAASLKAAPAPTNWIKRPLRNSWLGDPLVLDCAFQMMILWSFHRFEAPSLPCFSGRYRQYQENFPKDGVNAVIRITAERDHGATADMEFLDLQSGKLVARLEGYECVIDPALADAFSRNSLTKTAQNSNSRAA
ncbi:MAG: SDR family NAD(P)-dependent oxidoreductase, partial [Trichlorobacter sp.]|nr:SDR family NAD(P)-dependent oxidoreductase [Trichlorobacter sp.]